MANWFECKVRYEKTFENGQQKKVTDSYLVDAISFTEAENRIIEEMTPFISGEFEVKAVKQMNIANVFANVKGDKWYRCKVMYITLDEKNGVEKKSAVTMLVQAEDFQAAVNNLDKGMHGTISDWEINAISETNILDVYVREN